MRLNVILVVWDNGTVYVIVPPSGVRDGITGLVCQNVIVDVVVRGVDWLK
jgi:hypothetical protein